MIAHMPDGRPAPYLLTRAELIEFLRIDGSNPDETINYYRKRYALPGIQIGSRIRFKIDDIVAWLDDQRKRNPR